MMLELIENTVRAMGPVNLADCGVERFHVVPKLFRKNMVGWCNGVALNATSNWAVHDWEVNSMPMTKLLATIQKRRRECVIRIMDLVERSFYSGCGRRKNPNAWRVRLVPRGSRWIKESVVRTQQLYVTAVFMDLSYWFEQLPVGHGRIES